MEQEKCTFCNVVFVLYCTVPVAHGKEEGVEGEALGQLAHRLPLGAQAAVDAPHL